MTDKQIERLLLIYKEKERVPITEAISKLAITRRTYYRVINLNYKYEETRDRIRKIAFDLGALDKSKGITKKSYGEVPQLFSSYQLIIKKSKDFHSGF